ncbi:Pfk26p [Sugiyamaella lignohabitans]|uniref:Pfk26p n=1 Tax=Sugiyamaella lignohabitans TaxID=796027 RepID=A0A167D5M8_9ASCO|nr:Pfk26p [Sugiyamaella lignohabitans]ANB12513.1 Pfk26p [Sugiyamaella lignohabitans]
MFKATPGMASSLPATDRSGSVSPTSPVINPATDVPERPPPPSESLTPTANATATAITVDESVISSVPSSGVVAPGVGGIDEVPISGAGSTSSQSQSPTSTSPSSNPSPGIPTLGRKQSLSTTNPTFNSRPPSDTPVVSYTNSPKEPPLGGTHSADNSGKNSPRNVSTTSIPNLSLPQRRATTLDVPGLTRSKVSPDGKIAARDIESKLVIVMVGLPARGKSYVTKKLCRYLNWQQHETKIFNVGNTRRKANQHVGPANRPLPDVKCDVDPNHYKHHDASEAEVQAASAAEEAGAPETQSADFFSPDNDKTFQLREQWAMDTLEELLDFILEGNGSVGILDATNTTVARRRKVFDRVKERSGGLLKVLYLESICTRSDIIEANIRLKLSGPDYKDMDPQVAIKDFVQRMHNYEKAYETISAAEEANEQFQYVKMINVGQKVVCANIQGFLAGQAVFFLLNFNLAERQIWITRHGESEDNALGRIGGDAPLTERGRKFAKALSRFMDFQKTEFRRRQLARFAESVRILEKEGSQPTTPLNEPEEPHFCTWTSMLRRSVETADYFDEEHFDVKEFRMLNELGAGICDGMTYSEIKEKFPQEYGARVSDKIRYRYPGIGGESYLDVINRLRPVIVEMERMTDNCVIICHRVVARVLLAYFMNLGREAIGDLDVPLHTLYVLEPKPYGVDWALYEYNEETDWFYRMPKGNLRDQNDIPASMHLKNRAFSVVATASENDQKKLEQLRDKFKNTTVSATGPAPRR